jgi:hypothetical protein
MTIRASSARARPTIGTIVAIVSLTILCATPVLGAKPSAPGNNGTVKVHDGATEPSPATQNNPHVCDFHLDFLFADAGQAGDWWIESWSPGGDRSVVLDGSYLTDAAGYDREPATGSFGLADGHYKLSWEGAENPGGRVNLKHKVFWVDCGGDDPTDPPNDPPNDPPDEPPSN